MSAMLTGCRHDEAAVDQSDRDWWICGCGNDPADSGFEPCLADGTPVEPSPEEWTDGYRYRCMSCGVVFTDHAVESPAGRSNPSAD
jgi:hypothetical protein